MSLETGTYISDLVATNPTASDPKSQGDDHIRLLKATILATFPNIAGAMTSSQAELNILDGATLTVTELNILAGALLSTAELNILNGVTSTTAELNILDGVTSTAAELNILDGATLSVSELNILTGALLNTTELNILNGATLTTTELNTLAGIVATVSELNILSGATVTTAELNILDGATATTAEINKLAGAVVSTAEINYLSGVTSAIQTQLDAKAPLASPALTGNPTAPTQATSDDSTKIATTEFVNNVAMNAALPSQAGKSGKALTTDGTNADFDFDTSTVLLKADNLASVADAPTAVSNLGALSSANNLSDVVSAPTARTNIGAASTLVATTSANGLMSSTDKSKLDCSVGALGSYIVAQPFVYCPPGANVAATDLVGMQVWSNSTGLLKNGSAAITLAGTWENMSGATLRDATGTIQDAGLFKRIA